MREERKPADFIKAKNAVFHLLKIRLRSEKELRDKLEFKKFASKTIDETIQYFKHLELIDDRIFTQSWIRSRLKKPFGLNRIQQELKIKGIRESVIKDEIKKAKKDFNESETIQELTHRRIQKYKGLEPEKVKQRVYGYLMRRGFSSHEIYKVVAQL